MSFLLAQHDRDVQSRTKSGISELTSDQANCVGGELTATDPECFGLICTTLECGPFKCEIKVDK